MPLQNWLIYRHIIHHACGYCQLPLEICRKYSSLLISVDSKMITQSFIIVHFPRKFWIVINFAGNSAFLTAYVIKCSN
jgi:hypothetical protein